MLAYLWDHAKNKKDIDISARLFIPRTLGLIVSGPPMLELQKTMPHYAFFLLFVLRIQTPHPL